MTQTKPPVDYDDLAVTIVCVERVPMALQHADRVEAVRRLSAKGLLRSEIARLLDCDERTVRDVQRVEGIIPAPAYPVLPRSPEALARAAQRQKAYRDAKRSAGKV